MIEHEHHDDDRCDCRHLHKPEMSLAMIAFELADHCTSLSFFLNEDNEVLVSLDMMASTSHFSHFRRHFSMQNARRAFLHYFVIIGVYSICFYFLVHLVYFSKPTFKVKCRLAIKCQWSGGFSWTNGLMLPEVVPVDPIAINRFSATITATKQMR